MSIDQNIILWLNDHHTEFLDNAMWIVSQPTTSIPIYLLLIVLLWFKVRNWRTLFIILLGFAITVGLSDFICSGVLKPLIARDRPTWDNAMPVLNYVNNYKGGQYGFCSSHAANSMAVALLFSLLYRKKIVTVLLMIWVTVICFSRMYLLVHYPTDIIGGLVVGSLFAVVAWLVLLIVFHVDDEELQKGDS